MDTQAFYEQLIDIAAQAPDERHRQLSALHDEVAAHYIKTIEAITPEGAKRPGSDGRTVAQVVGHITEWERYLIQAVGELIAGVRLPSIMQAKGYVEPDGEAREFDSGDEFNAYQAEKHASTPWAEIKTLALRTADVLQRLFPQEELLSPQLLEETQPYEWHLHIGETLNVTVGWHLWMVTLELEAAEHAADLALGSVSA